MLTYEPYTWTAEDGNIRGNLVDRSVGWPINAERDQKNKMARLVFAYEQEVNKAAQLRSLLRSPNYSHSRFRSWCGVDQVYFYVLDRNSPSCVRLAMIVEAELADRITAEEHKPGALSPIEGL